MKVQCPVCQTIGIFAPQRDVIAFFPKCNKCGAEMVVIGKASVVDWVMNPKKLVEQIITGKNLFLGKNNDF